MTFQAYCPQCEKTVMAGPLLSGNELTLALDGSGDFEVMHTAENGDHRWSLDKQAKKNLRNAVARGTVKSVALIFVMLCASTAWAAPRVWKDANVVNIASSAENAGVVVAPVGTMLAGFPITTNTTLYQVETDDMDYILSYTFNPMVNWRDRPPNLTVHGKTKIAIDGRNAHVLDDEGKDIKVLIARKIARTQPPAENPTK